jgi:hypothetical protein
VKLKTVNAINVVLFVVTYYTVVQLLCRWCHLHPSVWHRVRYMCRLHNLVFGVVQASDNTKSFIEESGGIWLSVITYYTSYVGHFYTEIRMCVRNQGVPFRFPHLSNPPLPEGSTVLIPRCRSTLLPTATSTALKTNLLHAAAAQLLCALRPYPSLLVHF